MIEISRSYTFDAPAERVWSLLMDTDVLASCIMGCEGLEPDGVTENRYVIKLVVKLAAVMGSYNGSVQLVDVAPMLSYGLLAEGNGRPGFVKGKAAITLSPEGGSTVLTVKGEAQAGGAIARVGQRLLGSAARLMMDRFFKCLKRKAEGTESTGDDLDADETGDAATGK